MAQLRVLHIIPVMGLGGAEKMLGDICFEQHRRGIEVKIVTLHPSHSSFEKYPDRDSLSAITGMEQAGMLTRLKFFPPGIVVDSEDYRRILKEFKPNIIHSHLFQAELLAHSVKHEGACYFTHFHDNMFQLERVFGPARRKRSISDYFERLWLLRKFREFDTHFIAISGDTLNFARRVLPAQLEGKVSLLRNAFNHAAFSNNRVRGISTGRPIRLISVGNLVPKKNHKLLIETCLCLKRKQIPFTCEILGYGTLENELQRQIRQAGLEDLVFLRGSVPNVAEYLKDADIYIHPASYEPFGLVILEAMASGLPIICRNGMGNLDIHEEGKTGYLIEGDEPEKFADRIEYLIKHPEKYREISVYNPTYSRYFDITHYVEKLTELYRKALKHQVI